MMENHVREANPSDSHYIYLLNQDFNPNLCAFSEEKVRAKLEIIRQKTKDIILVYEQDNEVKGYIHGSPYELLFSESVVNILGFVVREGCRNQGIGSELIQRLEQWGRDHGYAGIKLLSHPSRTNAHRFYEKRGYKFTKDQKNYSKPLKE